MLLQICCGFLFLHSFAGPVEGHLVNQKSSLAFVIDDTYSMHDEIDQVKAKTKLIFNTVLESAASQIENFILVTFNDPAVTPAIVTTNENVFRNALDAIHVYGGGDCPEMAMKGIEETLKNTLPGSLVYVFTDAAAKDYDKYPIIKRMAQRQQSQIDFMLTGMCGSESEENYKVYHQLSAATSGKVFHIQKDEVGKILNYVAKTVSSRRTVITDAKLEPGYNKTLKFPVDEETKNLHIAVMGEKPTVDVFEPDGSKTDTEDVFKNDKTIVVEVPKPNPGIYTAKVGSESETRAVVTGATSLNFQHGFSPLKPVTIEDTATRPIRDKLSYLAIEVSSKDTDVELEKVELLDMEDNVIAVRPLKKVGKDFYVAGKEMPPNTMFKLAIVGYVTKTKTPIRRLSLTPIEPQTPSTEEKPVNKAPTVSIVGIPLKEVLYGEPIQLQCKVSGYPKPTVTWIDESSGATVSNMIEEVDLPYDYMSVYKIEEVKSNTSYGCRASNDFGQDKKSISVIALTKFVVLNVTNETSLEYGEKGILYCLIDAVPPAEITWYLNGESMAHDKNMEISANGSILTIKKMQPNFQGKYICEAKNELERKVFFFNLEMTGSAVPLIDDSVVQIEANENESAVIHCNVTQGIPEPEIRWSFLYQYSQEYIPLSESSQTLHINDVNVLNAGTYKCEAFNTFGRDEHEVELVVKYRPKIRNKREFAKGEEGKRILLECDVVGVPEPKVRWTFNGTVIKRSLRRRIYRDNALSFIAKLNDSGNYSCIAVNELGSDTQNIQVQIFGTVKIKPPVKSSFKQPVGSSLTLPCEASGHPKPTVNWLFISTNETKVLRPSDASDSLYLTHMQSDQSGYYVCVAKNPVGSTNITYSVKVLVPPSIVKTSMPEKYTAVAGDLLLNLPCNASGNPIPVITWTKDDLNIPTGTEWYDIKDDGTLTIKHIDDSSTGGYLCKAENSIGTDLKYIDVSVLPYPEPSPRPSTMNVEEGKSVAIDCEIPHKLGDKLTWYKGSEILADGELTLRHITKSDEGLYTCRVSNFSGAVSASKLLSVGYKPSFITDEDEIIDFYLDSETTLYCGAIGDPLPEVTWWHNEKQLNKTEMIYTINMSPNDLGRYSCAVSNLFGTITRNFDVVINDCLLKLNEDIDTPFAFTYDIRSAYSETNVLFIPKKQSVVLFCENGFKNFDETELEAVCVKESVLEINHTLINFTDLKCKMDVRPITKKTGIRCARGNTEMIKVGFKSAGAFSKVYDICYDKDKKMPIYATNPVKPSTAEVKDYENWFDNDLVNYNFDDLYDCKSQIRAFVSIRPLRRGDECCFAKRQLVNTKDVPSGLSQIATRTNLNLVPHWSTCNSKNWEEVEKRIRALVKPLDRDLVVITGTSAQLKFAKSSTVVDVNLSDRDGKTQQVPMFLWKVIKDEYAKASLAIIQVNVPDLTLSEATGYMLCRDVCDKTEWMRNPEWRNVEKGFTYCCTIRDFESTFGFRGQFSYGAEGILTDASIIPKHSLT